MKPVRPRELLHRGVVAASAFVIDVGLLGLLAARRRIFQHWRKGAAVYRLGADLLLTLPSSRWVSCRAAPGAPLVAAAGRRQVLLAMPLSEPELGALAVPPLGLSVVRAAAGEARVEPEPLFENPADWLELDSFELVETAPLAGREARPELVEEAVPVVGREAFGPSVGSAAPERAEILAALRQAGSREQAARVSAGLPQKASATAGSSALGWLIRTVGALFARLFPAAASQAAEARRLPAQDSEALALPPQKSAWPRLGERLGWLLARFLGRMRLLRLFGRRQAQYLSRMIEMFERGDLGEALRHAIPLSAGAADNPAPPALGLPEVRDSLALSLAESRSASSFFLDEPLFADLQRLYRAAFARLERAGEIDRAAFVLAELLEANEEAVQFLERHGRLRLAAELAEARALSPALVVRQWFLAGDRDRALRIARRHGAFADAVARLERSHRDQAMLLRLEWADHLALQGDFLAAVEVAEAVPTVARLVDTWIDRGIELGGAAGAQLLLHKLRRDPAVFPTICAQVMQLLGSDDPGDVPTRQRFLSSLAASCRQPETATLARAALRWQLDEVARNGLLEGDRQLRRQLLELCGDGALSSDLPPLPARPPAEKALMLIVASADAGSVPVHDVAHLPDGRMLVALGELGVRMLARDGRTIASFEQPAQRLVISDHGDRAIALSRRGEVFRLSRLDLSARRASFYCEARFDRFAPDFDGATWFVAEGDTVLAIDMLAERLKALWQVTRVGSPPLCLSRNDRNLCFAGKDGTRWIYELPSLTLRHRLPLPESIAESLSAPLDRAAVSPQGDLVLGLEHWDSDATWPFQLLWLPRPAIGGSFRQHGAALRLVSPTLTDGKFMVVTEEFDAGCRIRICSLEQATSLGMLRLCGSLSPCLRLHGELLQIADERGRILVAHLPSGRLIRDLRLTL